MDYVSKTAFIAITRLTILHLFLYFIWHTVKLTPDTVTHKDGQTHLKLVILKSKSSEYMNYYIKNQITHK